MVFSCSILHFAAMLQVLASSLVVIVIITGPRLMPSVSSNLRLILQTLISSSRSLQSLTKTRGVYVYVPERKG